MSCCGIYTVPKGYSMQFMQFNSTSKVGLFDTIILNVYVKPPNFCKMEIVEMYFNCFQPNIAYPIKYATPIGETSDMLITTKKKSLFNRQSYFGCYFQFVLISNEE